MKNTSAIFLLILSIGLFYTFTSPYYEKVKVLRASVQDYQNVLDNLSLIGERRDQLIVEYEDIPKKEIERINKVLPDNVDTVRMAQELDTIAARHGISIKNVRVDTASAQNAALPVLTENDKPYDKIILSFGFIANYANFRAFLEDLEKSLRLMEVKALTFQAADAPLYEYQASIETYWLK